jgi:hypothetical protein
MWPIHTLLVSRQKLEPNKMANEFWSKADCYRQWAEESVAMAKLAKSNRTRVELYAAAEYYLYLSKVEGNLAGSTQTESRPVP